MRDSRTPPRRIGKGLYRHPGFRQWKTGELVARRWFVHKVLPPSEMGIVYFCFDTMLGWPQVVKSMPPKYLADEAAQKRFITECETWIRIGQHPNVVRAHFVEVINEYPYVFVDWINGQNMYNSGLNAWIGTPLLSMDRIINITVQICDGMTYVIQTLEKEDHVFVHRDIKPSNVLITGDWAAKVTDFGIAETRLAIKLRGVQGINAQPTTDITGIQAYNTEFLGTPPYMSPEHFTDPDLVDQRSDIYSLGCTIFEMTVGEPVFRVDSWQAWQNAHMHQQAPRLSDVHSNVPQHVDELVALCLAKDPDARPQSFAEVKQILL